MAPLPSAKTTRVHPNNTGLSYKKEKRKKLIKAPPRPGFGWGEEEEKTRNKKSPIVQLEEVCG